MNLYPKTGETPQERYLAAFQGNTQSPYSQQLLAEIDNMIQARINERDEAQKKEIYDTVRRTIEEARYDVEIINVPQLKDKLMRDLQRAFGGK